ncbi:MAG TPA: AI-2E family transporter YdiK [Thermodesulfovibrionales bacterium]|nr:AI-2E family transporter YdiK [Thermodesulfovibrionales bacterium]
MTTQDRIKPDITRITLAVVFIGILASASIWILRPFITSIVWATIIVVATWPILRKIEKRFSGRRGLAVAVMTAALLLIVFIPLTLAVLTILGNVEDISARIKSLAALAVSPPPEWLERVPLVGGKLSAKWHEFAALSPEERAAVAAPYARKGLQWLLAQAGGIAAMMLQFLLTVIISAVMYAGGEKGAAGVLAFARRLAGQRGEEVTVLAEKAIRSVALGIVLTALIQTAIAGAGLVISGMPAAVLLTAVVFMLCLAQIGPALVVIPSVIWLYWKGDPLWATVLLIFSIIALTIDNFIRPVLIRKGADLPLIMIFAGVIGGLIAFGVIGLFIGPVVLAVTYTLLKAWVSGTDLEDRSDSHEPS